MLESGLSARVVADLGVRSRSTRATRGDGFGRPRQQVDERLGRFGGERRGADAMEVVERLALASGMLVLSPQPGCEDVVEELGDPRIPEQRSKVACAAW